MAVVVDVVVAGVVAVVVGVVDVAVAGVVRVMAIVVRVVARVVSVAMTMGNTDALLGLDVVIVLDVAFAGELNPPVSLDVIVTIARLVTVPVGHLYFKLNIPEF